MPEEGSGENPFFKGIEFVNKVRHDPAVDAHIDSLEADLEAKGARVNPFTTEYFHDPDLFHALPSEIRNHDALLSEYIEHTGNFNNLISSERSKRFQGDTSGLFGEEVTVAKTKTSNGRLREEETGYKINVDYLKTIGIDPARVLFFRATQPMSDQPKPERYWTSDFNETVKGLNREIPPTLRKTAVILVSDLQTVADNGGLLQDINDDSGLAVRQISPAPFNQHRAITQFKAQ